MNDAIVVLQSNNDSGEKEYRVKRMTWADVDNIEDLEMSHEQRMMSIEQFFSDCKPYKSKGRAYREAWYQENKIFVDDVVTLSFKYIDGKIINCVMSISDFDMD